jgi:hypothetical protein
MRKVLGHGICGKRHTLVMKGRKKKKKRSHNAIIMPNHDGDDAMQMVKVSETKRKLSVVHQR